MPSDVRSHFHKRCVSVTTVLGGRAEVRFADGSAHVADIVIGADGIKSAVRGQGTSTLYSPSAHRELRIESACRQFLVQKAIVSLILATGATALCSPYNAR